MEHTRNLNLLTFEVRYELEKGTKKLHIAREVDRGHTMHDQKKPIVENLHEGKRHGRRFPDLLPSQANELDFKDASHFEFKENMSPASPIFADFNRYSYPLAPRSPSGKASKSFKDVISETINTQRQEKRAVSLMPEILLHSAVLENNIEEILKLLRVDRIDVNRGTKLGLFSLHQAAFSGLEEVTEILVENGADLNVVTPEGLTPLETAVCAGNFECAEILIKNGAPVDRIKDGFVDRRFVKL